MKCVVLLGGLSLSLAAQQPAFPGAEGGGMYAVGGRGGRVIEVTNLSDSGTGSLRAAVAASGARTIVFRVSGTIILNSALDISKDSVTIAGQTAPGDGICIRRYPVNVKANQVVIRYLRFRLGDESGGDYDTFGGIASKRNIIVDHCSVSWSIDETLSMYTNDSLTVQWCIISESLYNSTHPKGAHGYAGIWGGHSRSSFHHNLLAHHSSRTPRITSGGPPPVPSNEVDVRNNVIYNWGFNSAYGGEVSTTNLVANYYKSGPATTSGVRYRIVQPYDSLGQWYVADNYMSGSTTISNDNWAGGVQGTYAAMPRIRAGTPFPFTPVTTQSAVDAYDLVLNNAGARLPKLDSVDLRIIAETRNGTATYGATSYPRDHLGDSTKITGIIDHATDVGGWPTLNSAPAPADADHDGMPDDWERAHALNPNDASDGSTVTASGYTNLELYLTAIVDGTVGVAPDPVARPVAFRLDQNYPNPFNPMTTISYHLASGSVVSLRVTDMLGREVAVLEDGYQPAGSYTAYFDGRRLASGMYTCRLSVGSFTQVRKMLLLK